MKVAILAKQLLLQSTQSNHHYHYINNTTQLPFLVFCFMDSETAETFELTFLACVCIINLESTSSLQGITNKFRRPLRHTKNLF